MASCFPSERESARLSTGAGEPTPYVFGSPPPKFGISRTITTRVIGIRSARVMVESQQRTTAMVKFFFVSANVWRKNKAVASAILEGVSDLRLSPAHHTESTPRTVY